MKRKVDEYVAVDLFHIGLFDTTALFLTHSLGVSFYFQFHNGDRYALGSTQTVICI